MTVGTPPLSGMEQGLVDATWLFGLAGGTNQAFVAGLAAPNAASQATATPIPANTSLVQIDSSVATGSVTLPLALAGTDLAINNNTGNAVNMYASLVINQLTGALDTINAGANSAPVTLTANTITLVMCTKNGKWYTK
jgi:hypothetical protein